MQCMAEGQLDDVTGKHGGLKCSDSGQEQSIQHRLLYILDVHCFRLLVD